MKALKIILGFLVVVAATLLVVAILAPAEYRVERTIEINAPAATIYSEARYFRNFKNFSPWHELDPAMKTTITGTDGEVGAKYEWASENENVGAGSLTRIKQEENKLLVSELRIGEWDGFSNAGFLFEETAPGVTKVTWYNEGDLSFVMRPMGLMMDRMMGKDFEKGLKNLKKHIEGVPG